MNEVMMTTKGPMTLADLQKVFKNKPRQSQPPKKPFEEPATKALPGTISAYRQRRKREADIKAMAKTGVTQAELARIYGVSRQRIHQIINDIKPAYRYIKKANRKKK